MALLADRWQLFLYVYKLSRLVFLFHKKLVISKQKFLHREIHKEFWHLVPTMCYMTLYSEEIDIGEILINTTSKKMATKSSKLPKNVIRSPIFMEVRYSQN